MTKFRVKKDPHATLHPWHVHNPEDRVVWRSTEQESAFSIARMFARRRALMEKIHAEGLEAREPDFELAHL
jgi:hypothetical protein